MHGMVWHGMVWYGMVWCGTGVQTHPGPVGQNSNRGENYPRTTRHTLLAAEKGEKRWGAPAKTQDSTMGPFAKYFFRILKNPHIYNSIEWKERKTHRLQKILTCLVHWVCSPRKVENLHRYWILQSCVRAILARSAINECVGVVFALIQGTPSIQGWGLGWTVFHQSWTLALLGLTEDENWSWNILQS